MSGSIRKRGAGWEYRISLTLDGKRKQKSKAGFKTKGECQKALTKALNDMNNTGDIYEQKNISFKKLFSEFVDIEAPLSRKYSTIKRYKSLYDNHLNFFDDYLIHKITSKDIQSFYVKKLESCSIEYVKSMHNLLLILFTYAKKMNYIQFNIMNDIKSPKNMYQKDDIYVYSKDELKLMYDRLSSTNLQTAFMLALHLGLRSSEVYALRWSDIDMNNRIVKIDKQLQYINGSWCFDTLKTQNSYRSIKFGHVLHDYLLKKYNERLMIKHSFVKVNRVLDNRFEHKEILEIDDFVNIKQNGEMLINYSHKVASRIFKKEFDFPFKFHNLRHTHATILLENGINPRYIQERLGHAKLEFTLRLYTHVTSKMNDDAVNIMDKIQLEQ